ncbi:MAG: NAD(P)/FAD-dependent oxidoreductase [Bacteroidales bacterium]|nr:NAD(P)/FAD-dependent oxidoreductase [Bacteroidales bacterium]
MEQYEVVVVGGGASGLIAAMRAAEWGCRVLLVEKKRQAGTKLRITGKGRCNLTNAASATIFYKHIYPQPRFLKHAFSRFFSDDIIELLNQLGVATEEERGGRVFPSSGKASDIPEALMGRLNELKVAFRFGSRVEALLSGNDGIEGVIVDSGKGKEEIKAQSVILCTGGKSYPATGSEGDGYQLARSVGHSVTPPRPALVPLETKKPIPDKMVDLVLKNVHAVVWCDGKKHAEAFGEMFFTVYGLSGSIILTLSRTVGEQINRKKSVQIAIDLKPALDDKKLDNRLLRDIENGSKKQALTLFKSWLPSALIPFFIDHTGMDPGTPAHQITSGERKRIRKLMKGLVFTIKGPRSFKEALVTAGGIPTGEIHSQTMESKVLPNLYIAGELLDLDGDTGGYNLQIAYSTGWLAGDSCGHATGD